MPVWILLVIMAVTGTLGGLVNFLLPANSNTTGNGAGKYIRPLYQCMILGIGATLLVPLFLELAQSKLLDPVCIQCSQQADPVAGTRDTVIINRITDSVKQVVHADTIRHHSIVPAPGVNATEDVNTGKSYLLFTAYCFLAAAAGFRFINMLIRNVVKEDEVNALRTQNHHLQKQKQLQDKANSLLARQEEQEITAGVIPGRKGFTSHEKTAVPAAQENIRPSIGPVIYPDDPQKGRFGGHAVNDNRQLKASVTEAAVAGLFNVQLWVESTNAAQPLTTPVTFYVHDSFRPAVFVVDPENGKAATGNLVTYRAFTAGAVTDNGETLLELDLATVPGLPAAFSSY